MLFKPLKGQKVLVTVAILGIGRGVALALFFFFFTVPAPPEIYPLPLHDALPILCLAGLGLAGCDQHPAGSPQPEQAVIAAGEIGSHLAEFSVKDLQGREISSADLRGKVVLVD